MKLQSKIIFSFFILIFLSFVGSYIATTQIWQRNLEERNNVYRERISKSISETLAMYYKSWGSFDRGWENVLVTSMTNLGLDPEKNSVGVIDSNFDWIIASPKAIQQDKNILKKKIDSGEYLVYPITVDFSQDFQERISNVERDMRRINEAIRLGFISNSQANQMISELRESSIYDQQLFDSVKNIKTVGSLVFLNEELKLEDRYIDYLIITFSAVFFISILFAFVISRQIANPIKKLTNATSKVAEGIFEPVESSNSNSEFSLLTKSFNSMTNRMKEIQNQREQLFSDISHELRNPLTVLRINIEGILDEKIKPTKEKFEQINNQIILMTNLVEDLSLIATAESGELSLNKKAIDIKEDINYAVDSFYESAKNKNIEVINKFNQPLILEADQKRVRQIFSNIISNAIKYINSNDQITIDQIEEEKVYKIKFIDNGPGISEDKLDRIFERFYKVDDNRSREIDGSGLGLAITKQICLSHGWDIEVLSLKDVGTEFHIIIPK